MLCKIALAEKRPNFGTKLKDPFFFLHTTTTTTCCSTIKTRQLLLFKTVLMSDVHVSVFGTGIVLMGFGLFLLIVTIGAHENKSLGNSQLDSIPYTTQTEVQIGTLPPVFTAEDSSNSNSRSEGYSFEENVFPLFQDIAPELAMREFCFVRFIGWDDCDMLNTIAEDMYYEITGELPVSTDASLLTTIPIMLTTYLEGDTNQETVLRIFDRVLPSVQVGRFCTRHQLGAMMCAQVMQAVTDRIPVPPIRHLYIGKSE
jgi:hypothetical protein